MQFGKMHFCIRNFAIIKEIKRKNDDLSNNFEEILQKRTRKFLLRVTSDLKSPKSTLKNSIFSTINYKFRGWGTLYTPEYFIKYFESGRVTLK